MPSVLGGAIATTIGVGTYALIVFFASQRVGLFRWRFPFRTLLSAAAGAGGSAVVWTYLVPERLTSVSDLVLVVAGGSSASLSTA